VDEMHQTIKRALVVTVFVGLLATPVVIQRYSAESVNSTGKSSGSESSARFGFHLDEVARASGIDFTHQKPKFDPKLDHVMPIVAAMGAGVSVGDFDRDGWPDLYVVNSGEGSQNRLYRNKTDGTFEDVASALGVADVNRGGTGVCVGAVWGDYDNDGYEDLFVYKYGRPELFHNDAGRKFSRVSDHAGLPKWVNAGGAIWLDFDRDGMLDLFIAGYWDEQLDLWHLKSTKMMPDSFEYAQNGGRKYLLRNRGDGVFEDVTEAVGIRSKRWGLCVAACDLQGTGYSDLFVANDYGVSELYANNGGKSFTEIGKESGVGYSPKSGMNVAFGDILNQGKMSIYVTNISEEGVLIQGNNLWVPREGTSGSSIQYDNLAREMGVELGGWSFGAQFGDLNNDGTLDLTLTNGYISSDKPGNYWYDYSKIAGGHSSIIGDAANWPALEGRGLSGNQPKRVWLNDGTGRFSEVAQAVGFTDRHDGRAVALVDLWNRGALDVVVANQNGPLLVYKNTVDPTNEWIGFDLKGARSNRSAIGARVELFWNGQQQVQEVSGGCGYSAQNQRRLHFGLGKKPRIEKAVVRWPSGASQTITAPPSGRVHRVEEPS
jgi:enediyne biosynthesis protein E4